MKIPRDVDVMRTRMPRRFEKARFTIKRMNRVIVERSL